MATKAQTPKAPKATQAPATAIAQPSAAQALANVVTALAVPSAPAAPATPPVWAQAPWAATLPRSLVAKGNGLVGAPKGVPAKYNGQWVVGNGKHNACKAHNLVWVTHCVTLAAQPGGATVAQMLASRQVGLHSIAAYIQRGYLVPAAAAPAPAQA